MNGLPTSKRPLRPAVFLDRDGTIIRDLHYLGDPAGVRLLAGVGAAISRLNAAGLPVVVATNQSGIGRGFFTEAEFLAVQARMMELLAVEGARVDASYHCPHAPSAEDPCSCRKPLPGLFLRASAEHRLDLARSWYVGDRTRDLLPGANLGGRGILLTGDGGESLPPGAILASSLGE
ncbi:MAG: HAD family hydrolase, partial [Gemmatimonadota bacterium]|nr:HAD family hydrolase [Gemmatimonadota bacterium]